MALPKSINKKRYDLFSLSRMLYNPKTRKEAITKFSQLTGGNLEKLKLIDERLYFTVKKFSHGSKQ